MTSLEKSSGVKRQGYEQREPNESQGLWLTPGLRTLVVILTAVIFGLLHLRLCMGMGRIPLWGEA